MKQKIVRGYFRNKEGVEVEGEYTMSKALTIAVKRVEETTGFKVAQYSIDQEPSSKNSCSEFFECCLLEGEGEGEVENVELINYCVKEEELEGIVSIATTFKDGICMIKNLPYREDIVSEEKFLKLLEE